MSVSNEELVKRIADLEAELAALKAQLPPPEKEFVRKPMPRFDPTENMKMPASAVKPMADVVHDAKGLKFDRDAWARTRPSVPGGFGAPVGPSGANEVQRGSGWRDQWPLEPQIKGKWSK
jgi:hypothetical protein